MHFPVGGKAKLDPGMPSLINGGSFFREKPGNIR